MANVIFNTNKVSVPCKATAITKVGTLNETVAGKEQSLCFTPTAKSEHIIVHVKNTANSICHLRFGKGDYVGAKESDSVFLEPQQDYVAFVDTGACLKNDGSIELIFKPENNVALNASAVTVKVIEFLPVENH
ncbi:MAG: hypothetical protein IKM53_04400 [Clostridia bacterium]|nr:hypothetical protein [Clostridia bacterium]